MSQSSSRPSMLGGLVDLTVQWQRDASKTDVELHRRDRALVAGLAAHGRDRNALLSAWLAAVKGADNPLPGSRFSAAFRLLLLALTGFGFFVGWGAAAAIFHYDGARPVNVVHVLAVFVAAQLALLVLFGIVALPRFLTSRLPGLPAIQDALAWISPGQAIRWVERLVPKSVRDSVAHALPDHAALRLPLATVRKWTILFAAQTFAVAFNVGALGACFYLVTFSDLAFAWSTTLEPNLEKVHTLTRILATPWAGWATEAVPTLDLIRETLYYRQAGAIHSPDPSRWGQWWPFLAACMITYGLFPRLLLLGVAGWRFSRAVRHAFLYSPAANVVIDRLTSQLVETQASLPEGEADLRFGSPIDELNPRGLGCPRLVLINWGGLETRDEVLAKRIQQAWQRQVLDVRHAGGRRSLAEDEQVIAHLAHLPEDTGVAMVVKAWEPPLGEFLDFVRELRQVAGSHRLLFIIPVETNAEGQLRPPREPDVRQWQKRLRQLGDAALVVRPWTEGGLP